MSREEKIAKLTDRERYLIAQLEEKNRTLEDNKKTLALIDDKENQYMQDIECVKNQNQIREEKLKSKIVQLKAELEKKSSHVMEVKSNHNATITKLQNDLKILKEKLNNPKFVEKKEDVSVKNEEFLEEMTVFKREVANKQKANEELQNLIEQLNNATINKEHHLEKINGNIKLSKKELTEAYNLFNSTEEDLVMLKNELHSMQNNNACSKDGNSLFDEVNEPRVDLQNKFSNLKKLCKNIEGEISIVQNRIMFLRQQYHQMIDLLKTDPSKSSQNHNFLIMTYKDTITKMKKVTAEYQNILNEKNELLNNDVSEDVFNFHEKIIKEKEKNHARLKEIASGQLLANKMMDIDVRENEIHLRHTEIQEVSLRKKIAEMQKTIEKTKLLLSAKDNLPTDNAFLDGRQLADEDTISSLDTVQDNAKKNDKKKVQFAEDVIAPSKKPGKVLQYKSIHFPSITKKK